MMQIKKVQILEILLHNVRVGYLSHYQDGKNAFVFDQDYIDMGTARPVLSLSFLERDLSNPQVSMMRLPPFFSNLLPEGALRELICEQLKVYVDDEFSLLSALGEDLPGAVIANSMEETPHQVLASAKGSAAIEMIDFDENILRFSLAGIQMKFSMQSQNGYFTLPKKGDLGHYIVKTPSNLYAYVPENEYSMLALAKNMDINVPGAQLVSLKDIHGLPNIDLPNEALNAFVVRRFDRGRSDERIHIEDFGQVFSVRSDRKYSATNYESMARLIYNLFPNGLSQLKEFIKRLIFNILIGNTDAHLQNWSVIYSDKYHPQLAPAYDLVSTLSYIDNRELALNLAKQKHFYAIDKQTLSYFAKRVGVRDSIVLNVADEVINKAKTEWTDLIENLPLTETMRKALHNHWQQLPLMF